MRFRPLEIAGVVLVEQDRREDDRGFFARTFCRDEFAAAGLPVHFPQCNTSFNARRGTVRGMHFQRPPHEEPKLVRCTRGAIFDAVVDLRPESPTYLAWLGVELSADNGHALYVPPGFAHGFQTLADATDVLYHMGEVFHPDAAGGIRWDDPAVGVRWPLPVSVISERDATYPEWVR